MYAFGAFDSETCFAGPLVSTLRNLVAHGPLWYNAPASAKAHFQYIADVAQSAEQPPCKRQVTGSIPVVGSILVG